MWTLAFWKDVGERSFRTFCASFAAWLSVIGGEVGIDDVNWLRGLSICLVATLYSALANLGTHIVTKNGPSVTSVYKETGQDDNSRT